MNKSIKTLRTLAKIYFELSQEDKNKTNLVLHRDVNDLKSTHPVVLIDEVPWHEMNIGNQLTLVCEDPYLREVEDFLRKKIFQYRYFPGNMILTPYIPINKIIHSTGIGVSVEDDTISQNDGNHIVSHAYHDQLATEEDLLKLHNPVITYDKATTLKQYQLIGDVLGDIIPIRITGRDHLGVGTWDDISYYRGVTPLLMDLIDRPEFTHKMVRKLTDIAIFTMNEYERLGLFDINPTSLHCTPIAVSALHPHKDSDNVTLKNIWGRGAAQILASASKQMRDEFDIKYMQETIGQCGLSYYGCCEPLDQQIDIVEKLPNLRKISITPWANVDIAAEAINTKYVLSSKPNPASVAVSQLNEDALRKELTHILDACKRNNCSCDIVLKDISTCGHNPQNLIKWEKIAMELVNQY